MRIVLSNASYQWGGVHRVTDVLASGLQARGHDVRLLCRPDSVLEERMRGRVPLVPVLRGGDLNPRALWRIAAELRARPADVVLTLMEKDVRLTAPVARVLGVPVVVRRANDRPFKRGPHFRLLYGAVPARHVANSEATRRTMLASASWLAPERVTVIHNGIDPAPFDAARPADLALPPDAVAIGFVGRFEERKGLLDLADAWPRVADAVPAAHLLLAGKGPAEEEARRRLAGAPRVHWLGFRADVPALMRAFDVLAVPSHWEGFGLVAAEALAAATPVVAADASSLPEIVRDGAEGLLVPPGDPAALADALVRLATDAPLRARLGAAGRIRVADAFSQDAMLDRYEALLREVAGGR